MRLSAPQPLFERPVEPTPADEELVNVALQVPGPPGRFVQESILAWFKSNFLRDPVRPGTFSEEDIRRYAEERKVNRANG